MRLLQVLTGCWAILAITSCASPLPTHTESIEQPTSPTVDEVQVIQDLIRFARSPGPETVAAIPFAEGGVWLGLSDRLLVVRSAEELADPTAWILARAAFRGHGGPFSALDLLARPGQTAITAGPHPHCASGPVPAPNEVAELRRISSQPTAIDTCLRWWTVDIFMTSDGKVAAVTLDLWDP